MPRDAMEFDGIDNSGDAGFHLLLLRLGPDGNIAGHEYDALRRKLLLFFRVRTGASAEALADETLDRVARKLATAEPVLQLRSFCYGVARRVLLEWLRTRAHERVAAEAHRQLFGPQDLPDPGQVERLTCCLRQLPGERRRLILEYYRTGSSGSSVETRRLLACRLGVSYGSLKVRAYRIRQELAACLSRCPSVALPGGRRPR